MRVSQATTSAGDSSAATAADDDVIALRLPASARWIRLARLVATGVANSAGFDADYRDPLAQLNWRPDDFAWLTLKLREIADRTCGGRIVSMLEGGYDRQGLATGVAAHVTALMS
jgi:acetoin utilization deacetylase AcuC-like enzyme